MSIKYNIRNNNNIYKTSVYFRNQNLTENLDYIKTILDSESNMNVYPKEEEPDNSYKNVTDYIYYRLIT